MSWGAIIGAGATIIGGVLSSKGSKDAAGTQATAIMDATKVSKERADEARASAVTLFAPALETFVNGMAASADEIANGRINTIDALIQSTDNADHILRQGALDAQSFLSQGSRGSRTAAPAPAFQSSRPTETMTKIVSPMLAPGADQNAPENQPTSTLENVATQMPSSGFGGLAEAATPVNPAEPVDTTNDTTEYQPSGRSRAELSQWASKILGDERGGINAQNIGSNEWRRLITANPDIAKEFADAFNATRHDYVRSQLDNDGLLPPGYQTTSGLTDTSMSGEGELSNFDKTLKNIASARTFSSIPRDSVQIDKPQNINYDFNTGSTPNDIIDRGVQELQRQQNIGFEKIDTGTGRGIDELRRGEAGSLSNIASGTERGLSELNRGRRDVVAQGNRALGELNQYADTGESALYEQAAITGALGPEAQKKAMDAYQESPGQKYLRERQEQSLLRNAAAIGGLGGGNVRTALQEQAMGIASTDLQRHVSNLANISGLGAGAVSQQAGVQQDVGGRLGAIASQGSGQVQQSGLSAGNILAQLGSTAGGFEQAGGLSKGSLAGSIAGMGSNLRGTQAGIEGQLMQQRALLAARASENRAGLQTGLGSNLGNLEQSASTNIANTIAQSGSGASDIQTQLATILANIATGQGSEQSNLIAQAGSATAAGQLGAANAWGSALENLGKIDWNKAING